jgi:hypothetical protein
MIRIKAKAEKARARDKTRTAAGISRNKIDSLTKGTYLSRTGVAENNLPISFPINIPG